ncbi:MAG TPA: HPr family phosphocarrier protein [Longimicrobiales bacterium]|nr:HPr family phosphocarrier protein [Longimicrobiales bacterium]
MSTEAERTQVERSVRISNKYGLHARPAAEFVKLAGRFRSNIWVSKEGIEVNGKSIMGVMMLAAEHGSDIAIRADGEDAELAVQSLVELVESGFGEN